MTGKQSYRFFESLPVTVNFTDGTALDLSGNGGGIRPEDGKTVCQKGRVFEEILDLSTVESVTVGGHYSAGGGGIISRPA